MNFYLYKQKKPNTSTSPGFKRALQTGLVGACALASMTMLMSLAKSSFADSTLITPAPLQTQPAASSNSPEYKVAPQDMLSIVVVDNPSLSLPQALVASDGTLSLPLIQSVPVAGKSIQEIDVDLTNRYKKYLVAPSVSVSLLTMHQDVVIVSGFVNKPGSVPLTPQITVAGAIALAGGPTEDGDLSKIVLTSPDGSNQQFDVSANSSTQPITNAIQLEKNDVIYVPDQHREVSVVGDVQRPGAIDYQDQMTVLAAVTLAGGVNPDADLVNATVIHDGVERPVDLNALMRKGVMTDNILLSAGDRVLVPIIPHPTYVMGMVAKPGMYVVQPGDHLIDALNGAGGSLPQASLGHVRLIHTDSSGKQYISELNVYNYLKSGSGNGDPAIQQGDLIFVPNQKQHFELSDLYYAF